MTTRIAPFQPDGQDSHYLPNELQRLTILAALGPTDSAQQDVSRWEQVVDLDHGLDAGTFRLLPLLAARIEALRLQCVHAGRVGGVAKAAWVQNERIIFGARGGVETLVEEGMTVTLLKGAALGALSGLRTRRTRPMGDVDILVDADNGPVAYRLLCEQGWRPSRGPTSIHRWYNGMGFEMEGSPANIDLHWRVLPYPTAPQWDAWLRADTTATSVSGIPVRIQAIDRLLVHTIAHGARPNAESPIRWVADAHQLIVEYPSAIDWDAVTAIATDIHMARRFAACLGWLRCHLGTPVPLDVVKSLRDRGSVLEHLEVAIERTPGSANLLQSCVGVAIDRIRLRPQPGWEPVLGTRPHFFRDRYGLTRARQVPGAVCQRISRRGSRARG